MKKKFVKTMVAAVCVVAAGVSGMKAYNAANQSEADMLLAENVEALSSGEIVDYWCAKTNNFYSTCQYACYTGAFYNYEYNIRYCW